MRRGPSPLRSRRGYAARVARRREAVKGPGEDSAGGVTFRPDRWAMLRNLLKPWKGIPETSILGYDVRTGKVTGGIACAQWLTTLTGESPTSSRPTPAAGRVTRVDKALPKRRVYAAARRCPTRANPLWGWQLSRCSDDSRDRETQRKETPRQRTMRIVNPKWCDAMSSWPGPLSGSRGAVKKHFPRHAR